MQGYGNRPRGNDRGFGKSPPVNVGDELDVRIEAVGEKGDGVAKKDGFVLFIPGVKEGDQVRVKVSRVLRQVGFADVVGRSEGPIETEEQSKEAKPDQTRKEENFNYDESKDSENFGEEDDSKSEDEQQSDSQSADSQDAEEEPASDADPEEEIAELERDPSEQPLEVEEDDDQEFEVVEKTSDEQDQDIEDAEEEKRKED